MLSPLRELFHPVFSSTVSRHYSLSSRALMPCFSRYSCMNLGLGSVGGFLPTIIRGFGAASNARAQLLTVPPYAVALVFMLLLTSFSDNRQSRGIPVAVVFCIGIVGWSILLSVPAAHVTAHQYSARYFGCICVVVAGYTNIPLVIGES